MAYHVDLLQHALDLLRNNPENPTQPDLRRAVSAAYYSLFHLLISETAANWSHADSRGALSRLFEHSAMATASKRILDSRLFPFTGENPAVVDRLKSIASAFGILQYQRHSADYDTTKDWTYTEALDAVRTATQAMSTWTSIRDEKIAQDYLVSLLIKQRRTP